MARLPQPGGDSGNWGQILNEYLLAAHAEDGALKNGVVHAATLANASVRANHLGDGVVTSAKVSDGAITVAKLADNAVSATKIADSAVGSTKLADGSVDTAKLANDAVTSVKLADNSVINSKIVNGSVSSAKLADSSVTTTKLADAAVTLQKIASAGATNGQVLGYDGTTIVWRDLTTGQSYSLNALDDVTITSAAAGDFLTYNAQTSAWVNSSLEGQAALATRGGSETLVTADISGSYDINLAQGNVFSLRLTGNTELSFSGAVSGRACSVTIYLHQDGTGSRSIWTNADVRWSGGWPAISTAANATDIVVFETINGGTTWYASLVGTNFAA